MNSKDLKMKQAEFSIDLAALIGEIDFNEPATVKTVLTKVSQVMANDPNPVAKGTGLWLKYAGDLMEQGLTDMRRQEIKPGDTASALANSLAMVFGFVCMGLTESEKDFHEVRSAIAHTFKEALYHFAIFHPDSELHLAEDGGGRRKTGSGVPAIMFDINDKPGTVH